MGHSFQLLMICLSWVFIFVPGTHQLQSSQTQVLQQLKKHLEYPKAFEAWNYYNGDLCYAPSSPQISIACEGNSITELKIMGDMSSKVSIKYEGFPIPNQTLSAGFSIDSFVTTLSRLTTLKVLSLVSLGIWGPLPDKIHRLYSLELLDMSSNFLYGSIPPKISSMAKLRILSLDGNFFNDTVPNWFDSLSNLTVLCAKNNQLKGPIPSSLSKIKTLTDLALSHNKITGKLPDLSGLTSLHVLDLRENQIESLLPIMPKGLITVLLSKNSFTGEIPKQFGEMGLLQHLDISFNFLQGAPPAALFSLQNISYLNLASNMLTGSLPSRLNCSGVLGFVDISNNRLSGGLPSCLSSTSAKRVVKFGANCLSVDLPHQHQASYCKEVHKNTIHSDSGGKNVGILVAVIGGSVLLIGFLALVFFICCRRCCSRGTSQKHLLPRAAQDNSVTGGFSSEILANARFISEAAKLGTQGVPVYRLFSIEELKEATNNFHHSTFMGEGSIGKNQNFDVKINVPNFDGKIDTDGVIDWLNIVEKMLTFKKCTRQRAVTLVETKPTGSEPWSQSVDDYASDFYMLSSRVVLFELEAQLVSRFRLGFTKRIQDEMILISQQSLSEIVEMARRVEAKLKP
ncbi:hypothetical protein GIB67_020317 [Kingdonia uniflora]|uniref:Uncharacterized protein n=1 Tax=Kingdonia uniflora TaxID=39325 RepID=A0A7J7NIG6_9MAGN|nr:hypothetical protein GIB67_020317 [Kingdonia uniflora]